MMMESLYSGIGADGGPISPDNYKKAVYRAPPAKFYVEMLSPTKQGGSFSYGMRISAIGHDGQSISSKGSHSEYEVWRRWEDCLWFQEVIELEYARMARAKRSRLVKGRGVKKNGIYIHDQAASFESLPPGPDPNSVAQDIHEFVPKLTKKGTVFRASQATIDQRYREFEALIDGLFTEDAPSLVSELREQRLVTDFFGFWRRDHDLALKQTHAASKQPRNSVSSSVFSAYFSASTSALASSETRPPNPPRTSPVICVSRSRPQTVSDHCYSPSKVSSSPGSSSSRSSRSSGALEEESLRGSSVSSVMRSRTFSSPSLHEPKTPTSAYQEVPILVSHKPQHISDYQASVLESLPEDHVIGPVSSKPTANLAHSGTKRKTSSGSPRENRHGQIFISPPANLLNIGDTPLTSQLASPPARSDIFSANRSVRESWQTTTSVTSYLDGLDINLQLVSDQPNRASVATFMTTASADAVIPRSELSRARLSSRPRRKSSIHSRRLTTLSDGEYDEDLDAYFFDPYSDTRSASPNTFSDGRPETALGRLSMISLSSRSSSDHLRSFFRPESRSSASTSMSSDTSSSLGGTVTIKAAHNNSIVMLRVPCTTSFEEVRKRLYDKFVGQEGVPLSESFTIAYLLPPPASDDSAKTGKGRARSSSISSATIADCTQVCFITSEKEWEQVIVQNASTKLSFRILDSPT